MKAGLAMERYKVSGEDLRNFYDGNIALERVFSDIEKDLQSTDQVVCRYILNGLEIAEYEEARFSTVTLDQVDTLEYMTENTDDLTKMVLKGWIEAMPELMQATENLARQMRAQGLKGLLRSIHELVQNCEYLIDSTISIKAMMGDKMLSSHPLNWTKTEEHSKKTVSEALRALEKKDFIHLADVLEYDLNHMLEMWTQHLKFLEKALDGEQPGSNLEPEQTRSHPMGWKRIAN
jgi:hypothetical protein